MRRDNSLTPAWAWPAAACRGSEAREGALQPGRAAAHCDNQREGSVQIEQWLSRPNLGGKRVVVVVAVRPTCQCEPP